MRFTKTSVHFLAFACLALTLAGCASKPERKVSLPSWVDIYDRYDEDGNPVEKKEPDDSDEQEESDAQPESSADASDQLTRDDDSTPSAEEAPQEKKASSLFEFFTRKKDPSDKKEEEALDETVATPEPEEPQAEETADAGDPTDVDASPAPQAENIDQQNQGQEAPDSAPVAEATPVEPAKPVIPKPKPLTAVNEKHAQEANQAKADYQDALELMRDGQEQDALLLFQEISARYPSLAGPAINQAIILRKQNKFDLAKAVLQKALLNKTQNPYLLTELGLVYRELGNFEAAKQSYLSAIRIEPNYDKAHYNLGVLADLYLHDPQLAATEFEAYQALQDAPDKKVAGWLKEIKRRIK